MKRTYLSGSEKRKVAAVKKSREEDVISKVPRINAFLHAV